MIPVVVETPYAGATALNLRYLRACMRDCLQRGEAPFASHHLYTAPGVLRDEIKEERALGIEAGFAWRALAYKSVLYVDLGWTDGMRQGFEAAARISHLYEERRLGDGWFNGQLAREAAGRSLEHWLRSMGAP